MSLLCLQSLDTGQLEVQDVQGHTASGGQILPGLCICERHLCYVRQADPGRYRLQTVDSLILRGLSP